MELRHLRAFVTVAESRSFSKAARHLYVSQPPLSRHIRQLEEELGVTVFERTPSGVTLTREGTVLLERARTVLAEANAFLELASRAKVGAANPLKVGMARGLCEVVNRIRLDLASRRPEIAIEGIDMASSLQYDAEAGSCAGCGEASVLRMFIAATCFKYGPESVGVFASLLRFQIVRFVEIQRIDLLFVDKLHDLDCLTVFRIGLFQIFVGYFDKLVFLILIAFCDFFPGHLDAFGITKSFV